MYAPLGVMIWLRRGGTSRTALAAATLGGSLALMIEVGRGLKPGLQPDVTVVLVGAIAAAAANRVMQMLWPTMLALPTLVSPTPSWPTRSSPAPSSSSSATPSLPKPSLPAPSSATLEPPIAGPSGHAAARTSPATLPVAGWLPLRVTLAILCLAAASVLAWEYPLGNWQAPVVLVGWLVAMWLRPVLWFVLLPAIMPSLDLAPWTGWIAISEADIAVLATVAVLLLRAPPTRQDIWPNARARVHLFPRLVLALVTLAWLIGMARGFSMTANFPGGSDNPYLIWLNTVRLAKPFLCALVLLPFMRARQREHGDAALLFSIGMLAGLALVGLAALAERTAFTSLSDIHDDYRITATFSSMHVGGGHIGAYLAFAMPFLVVCLLRPRLWTLMSLIILLPLSGYTLAVTFARTAYLATFASMVLTCCAWMIASRRRGNPLDWVGGALIAVAVAVALIAGLNTDFMRARMSVIWANLATREANWGAGLDRRDSGLAAFLLGMGTGSYPRFAALRSPPDQQPGTYVVRHDGQRTFLATMFGPDFYFGQKVQVVHGATYTVAFDMRAPVAGTQVRVLLCTKLLLYSADCHVLHLAVGQAGVWQHVEQPLQAPVQHGRLPAPVDLSFATGPGTVLDLGNVQLVGPDGRPGGAPRRSMSWPTGTSPPAPRAGSSPPTTIGFGASWIRRCRSGSRAAFWAPRRCRCWWSRRLAARCGHPARRPDRCADCRCDVGGSPVRLLRQYLRGPTDRAAVRSGGDARADAGLAAERNCNAGRHWPAGQHRAAGATRADHSRMMPVRMIGSSAVHRRRVNFTAAAMPFARENPCF